MVVFIYVTFVFSDNYPIQVTETIMAHMLMLMTHKTCNGSRSQRVRLKISGGVKDVQLTAVAASPKPINLDQWAVVFTMTQAVENAM